MIPIALQPLKVKRVHVVEVPLIWSLFDVPDSSPVHFDDGFGIPAVVGRVTFKALQGISPKSHLHH
jgi:hypothetical protein